MSLHAPASVITSLRAPASATYQLVRHSEIIHHLLDNLEILPASAGVAQYAKKVRLRALLKFGAGHIYCPLSAVRCEGITRDKFRQLQDYARFFNEFLLQAVSECPTAHQEGTAMDAYYRCLCEISRKTSRIIETCEYLLASETEDPIRIESIQHEQRTSIARDIVGRPMLDRIVAGLMLEARSRDVIEMVDQIKRLPRGDA